MTTRPILLSLALLGLTLVPFVTSTSAIAEVAPMVRYHELKTGIRETLPGTTINIVSAEGGSEPSADVSSILYIPFDTVAPALSNANNWCQFMPLHFNIKACIHEIRQGVEVLTVYSGRKTYQSPEESFEMTYRFEVMQQDESRLSLHLRAEDGPAGTRDYRIALEALRVEEGTLVHIHSSYRPSFLSSMLTHSYLATFGHDKVGFSRVEQDGKLHFVKGIRGVIERNVMRYHFAINAFLTTQAEDPPSRYDAALLNWYSENERYPEQLHEMSETDYLTIKRRERNNQQQLQQALNDEARLVATP